MSAKPLTEEQFRAKSKSSLAEVEKVVLWLRYECDQRVRNRSYGDQEIRISWEDGEIRATKVTDGHVMLPNRPGELPNKNGADT